VGDGGRRGGGRDAAVIANTQRIHMNKIKRTARVVETKIETSRLFAKIMTCPLRIAFVIREDIDSVHLAQVLEFNSLVWGGFYNCLIPTDGQTIAQDWWRDLWLFRPDKVVFVGGRDQDIVSSELLKKIQGELQPFSCCSLHILREKEDIAELHRRGVADRLVRAMPMVYPLQHLLDNLRAPIEEGESNVRIPVVDKAHPLYPCVVAQVGVAKGVYDDAFRDLLKAEAVEFTSDRLGDYLECLSEFDSRAYPLEFTRHYIEKSITLMHAEMRPEGLCVVLLGRNPVSDMCLFWNLRLTESWFGGDFKELVLPIDALRNPTDLRAFVAVLKDRYRRYIHAITLLSTSVSRRRLKRLAERIREHLNAQIQIKTKPLSIANFHLESSSDSTELTLDGNHFLFRRPAPEFGQIAKSGEWAVRVKLRIPYEFPVSSRLNHLLCGSPKRSHGDHWIRYADGELICRVSEGTGFTGGFLVKAPDAFQAVFDDRGFSAQLSEKRAYAEGFLSLLDSPKLLEEPGVRDLLWEMQNGKTHPFGEMKSFLRMGAECDSVIDTLVESRILLRGMSFECESCGLSRWYPINTLDEQMQCAGCLKMIRPPSRAPIAFRLNELVARAVGQGSIPVILTHRVLSRYLFNKSLSLFGVEVTKGDLRADIDLVTTHQGFLVLAECKDFKKGVLLDEKRKALRQLRTLVKVADQAQAPIVLLSTLLPGDAPEIVEFAEHILKLNKRGSVAVHLLSLSQMGFVNLRSPEKMLEHPDLFLRVKN
jgi:hypothetical protein